MAQTRILLSKKFHSRGLNSNQPAQPTNHGGRQGLEKLKGKKGKG
jgi:hypothetical protein